MNFTLADLLNSLLAMALFVPFLIAPGYALGWALDLVGFRRCDAGVKLMLSLPLSVGLMPVALYLAGRISMGWPVWVIYGALFCLFFVIARWRGLRPGRFVWALTCVWVAVALLSLVDWQIGKELYYSVVAYDLNFRSAVTGAFVRAHALPAANPFYSNGKPQVFRYHYFWFLLCAMPVKLAQVLFSHPALAPRHSVIASAAWGGLALFAIVALFLRFFVVVEEAARRRVTTIALLLIGVSGLDIVPWALTIPQVLLPTVDWWNWDQVTSWVDTMLWVPHALGSLIACLMGLLILWKEPRFRWQSALGAGLCFGSAVGLSIYVTLVFAIFALLWTALLARARNWGRVANWAAAGIAAGILAAPFLRELAAKTGGNGRLLLLQVRFFQPVMLLLRGLGVENALVAQLANLICLPLAYFLELGFFAVVAWHWFRQRRAESPEWERAAWLMLLVTLGFCSLVRSNVIAMNDLGARGMLIAQFVLVLRGAVWLAAMPRWHWLVKATLVAGVLTTVLEVGLLRGNLPLADHGWIEGSSPLAEQDQLGLRTFSARAVYEEIARKLPPTAVVQHDPSGGQDIPAGLYSNRQMAMMDLDTAETFVADNAGPEAVLAPLKDLFEDRRQDPVAVCRQLGISALVVKDVDDAWRDPQSWVWHTPVLSKQEFAIGLDCR